MKEFYNSPRITATLLDNWTEIEHNQEINFCTFPFASQDRADQYTLEEIERWIKDRGNQMYDTSLELISWEPLAPLG